MAAVGGIMAASRLLAVNQSSGAGDFLLLAIAGPVIAGTSLFGGRGSVWHALLGALVIQSISNGMDLLGLESSVKFMVTGAVLLAGRDGRRDRAHGSGRRRDESDRLGAGRRASVLRAARPSSLRGRAYLRGRLIGYGVAGAAFHAPLIEAVPGLSLAAVVTSNAERAAQAAARIPGAAVLSAPDALLEPPGSHDLVVVAAPNRAHVPLALAALRGRDARGGGQAAGRVAWPTRRGSLRPRRGPGASRPCSRTAAGTGTSSPCGGWSAEASLGSLWRFESRFERWRPALRSGAWRERGDPEDAGGLLFDLGSHLIDQALVLLRAGRARVRGARTRDARAPPWTTTLSWRSSTRAGLARTCG